MTLVGSLRPLVLIAFTSLAACAQDIDIDPADGANVDADADTDAAAPDATPPATDVPSVPTIVGVWNDTAWVGSTRQTLTFVADGTFTNVEAGVDTGCTGSMTVSGTWSATSTVLTIHFDTCSGSVTCPDGSGTCPPHEGGTTVQTYTLSADGDTLSSSIVGGDGGVGMSDVLTRIH